MPKFAFDTFGPLYRILVSVKYGVHFGSEEHDFRDWSTRYLVIRLTQDTVIGSALQGMESGEFKPCKKTQR
jgi:hypothetical protein